MSSKLLHYLLFVLVDNLQQFQQKLTDIDALILNFLAIQRAVKETNAVLLSFQLVS